MKKRFILAAMTACAVLTSANWVSAQVAGATTTVGVSITESTQLAMGWSVKKTLMGKSVYNDAGQKVGTVQDLIISPDRNVSYVIVGAGGFVGIGRHDVAIPVVQIQDRAGKLIMAGATKDAIKALPRFEYATDTTRRDQFVATAEKDIANGKKRVADLEKATSAAAADVKVRIDSQVAALKSDVTSAEGKLTELKKATVTHWRDFEAGVSAATARVRKSLDAATG
ncbi:MAG: PRC-barrel domain-containing protein [Burkholderiales bacterium]|nr:PRC-barrel domain-containing protein [Burkholderiales bacterium]